MGVEQYPNFQNRHIVGGDLLDLGAAEVKDYLVHLALEAAAMGVAVHPSGLKRRRGYSLTEVAKGLHPD